MTLEGPQSPDMNGKAEQRDFSKGCTIKANHEMPFLGVKKGDVLPLTFDGTYLRIGPLTWDSDKLNEELEKGLWTLESIP